MYLWHLGVGAAIVYVTLGRRRIDYRFILAGSVLPDVVDTPLSALLGWPAGRGICHTLLVAAGLMGAVAALCRGRRRLAWFGLPVGWLTHLVADGMWAAPRTFLWPAFGTRFAARPVEPYSLDLVTHPLAHPWTWGGELAGAALLAWFAVAFRLTDRARLRTFLRDGYLRP